MRFHTVPLSLAALVCSVCMTLPSPAQERTSKALKKAATTPQAQLFEAPVRLKSGEDFLGSDRLYPSPVVQDLDKDGVPELVIGDLFGRVTVTKREKISGSAQWGKTTKLLGSDGKEIKFSNW